MSGEGNFVTRDAAIGRGRPKKHASPAERQRAYRQRKAIQGGIRVGVPVRYKGDTGIVYRFSGAEAYVAFLGPPRSWREIPLTDLQIVGKVRKLPLWTDPDSPSGKHSHYTVAIPKNHERDADFGGMDGIRTTHLPVYFRGTGRQRIRDYSRAIDKKLAALMTAAKGRQ
jgi:hypothetical protein